jgi:hypothetical protein
MLDIPFMRYEEVRPMTIIPVEMVKISDVTNVREMVKIPEPQKDKPEPPKKVERAVEMPPPPPKMASTMPLEVQQEKPKVKPKAPVKRAAAPRVTPKAKPRPPSRFSSDRIAALLNKVEPAPKATDKLAEKYAQQPQQMSALDLRVQTISIADAVRKRIYDNGCWNVVSGSIDASNLKVTVSMRLTPDGNLARTPEVLNSARDNGVSEGAFRTASESALRAVRKCAPYDMLPKDKYDLWQEMQINFDPKDMLAG